MVFVVGDWAAYNEALVRRGEILLDFTVLKDWGRELNRMNRGKEGRRYRYPWSFIKLLGFSPRLSEAALPATGGFCQSLSPVAAWTGARLHNRLPPRKPVADRLGPGCEPRWRLGGGLGRFRNKGYQPGGWIRRKWKAIRGYLKIHLVVDVKSKKILSMEITDERTGDAGYRSLWSKRPRSRAQWRES